MAATTAQYASAAADQVALLRSSDFAQVAAKARAMKLTVKPESKPMEHPVEDGSVITDHRVLLPVDIDLSMVLAGEDYRDTYQELKTLFTDGELLIVQSKVDNFPDMIIAAIPHEESPDMTDAVPVAVKLRQVKTVKASYGSLPPRAVARRADASAEKRGEVSGSDASADQKQRSSVLASVLK